MVKKIAKQVKGLAKALPDYQIIHKKTIDKHTRKDMEKYAWDVVNKMMTRHSCRYSELLDRRNFPELYKEKIRHIIRTKFNRFLDKNGDFKLHTVDDTNFDFFHSEMKQLYEQWRKDIEADSNIPYTDEQLRVLRKSLCAKLERDIENAHNILVSYNVM